MGDVVKTVGHVLIVIGFSNYELGLLKTAGNHQYDVHN